MAPIFFSVASAVEFPSPLLGIEAVAIAAVTAAVAVVVVAGVDELAATPAQLKPRKSSAAKDGCGIVKVDTLVLFG